MNKIDNPIDLLCPGCGVPISNPTNPHLVKNGFPIVRCRHCTLQFLANRNPGLVANLYQTYYQEGGLYNLRYKADDPRRGPMFEHWLDIIERIKPNGKLLDVGSAYGEFLQRAANRRKWDLFGVEIDPEAAKQAGVAAQADVRSGRIEEQTFSREYFDIVTAFELIEHLPDPRETIRRMAEWLKPEGIFCVSTPNLNKLKNRISKRARDSFYIPPEHLLYFNRRALRTMFVTLGFKPLLIDAGSRSLIYKLGLYSHGKQSSATTRRLEAFLRLGQGFGIEGFQIVAVFLKPAPEAA
jgi:SAM-dependent methyltransferase